MGDIANIILNGFGYLFLGFGVLMLALFCLTVGAVVIGEIRAKPASIGPNIIQWVVGTGVFFYVFLPVREVDDFSSLSLRLIGSVFFAYGAFALTWMVVQLFARSRTTDDST